MCPLAANVVLPAEELKALPPNPLGGATLRWRKRGERERREGKEKGE